ncbi:MAG: hypothetical protein OXE94_06160 [Aestuariivita sp.]|nr:hypothetical protein [Aestuariivita sp.]
MTELHCAETEWSQLWLSLEPIDTLFFRDGRPFDESSRAVSGLPNPQILAGALRTELLRSIDIDFKLLSDSIRNENNFKTAAFEVGGKIGAEIAQARFCGPYISRKENNTDKDQILFPVPCTLRLSENQDCGGELIRLDPLGTEYSLPGWRNQSNVPRPLWAMTNATLKIPENEWITCDGMTDFLRGRVPSINSLVSSDSLYSFEDRTGIAIDVNSGTAQEKMIYGTRRLVLKPAVKFLASITASPQVLALLPKPDNPRLLFFGGEGRQAVLTSYSPTYKPLTARIELPQNEGNGRILVLTTPGHFGSWRPNGLRVLSAAVSGHIAISGWDLAREVPKPTRFAVQAGSVYFLSSDGFRDDMRSFPYGLGNIVDTSLGWGDYCEGVWFHASNL